MRDNTIRIKLLLALVVGFVAIAKAFAMAGCSARPTVPSQPDEPTDATDVSEPDEDESDDTTDVTGMRQTAHSAPSIVATQMDRLSGDGTWCGTMQLCWNALMDDLNNGKPVLFVDDERNTEEVGHLNERLFSTDDLSKDHHCTYSGPMTYEAKEGIERDLSDRLGQKSEILDSLDGWTNDPNTATRLMYAMIYRKFSFTTPFGVFEDGWFGGGASDENRANGVTYFEAQDGDQREQVVPLYHEDDDKHAVSITTAEGDEVILVKSPEGETFDEIWENAMERADRASSEEVLPLGEDESFRCPNLDIDLTREYEEWEGGSLALGDEGDDSNHYVISQALQTLRLSLDNEGGEVKSEAAIVAFKSAAPINKKPVRHFDYDDTFALFIRDGNAGDDTKPYVAVLVSDITQFQHGATKA